jgi:hypothetical protein
VIAHTNVIELEERTMKWLWQFTICVGVTKREQSTAIRRHVRVALEKLQTCSGALIPEVMKRFECEAQYAERIVNEWRETLMIIVEASRGIQECEWYADAEPESTLDN